MRLNRQITFAVIMLLGLGKASWSAFDISVGKVGYGSMGVSGEALSGDLFITSGPAAGLGFGISALNWRGIHSGADLILKREYINEDKYSWGATTKVAIDSINRGTISESPNTKAFLFSPRLTYLVVAKASGPMLRINYELDWLPVYSQSSDKDYANGKVDPDGISQLLFAEFGWMWGKDLVVPISGYFGVAWGSFGADYQTHVTDDHRYGYRYRSSGKPTLYFGIQAEWTALSANLNWLPLHRVLGWTTE